MSRIKTLLLFFLCSCLQLQIQAQEEEKLPKKISEYIQEAEQALLRFDDKTAERIYLQVLEKKPTYAPALRGLAVAYDLQYRYEESAKLLEQIVQRNPKFSRVIYYDIAVAHYRYGNYEASLNYFHQFDSLKTIPIIEFGFNGRRELQTEAEYRSKLAENIYASKVAKDSIFNKNVLRVTNLGAPVNTESNEYFPFMSNDQELLFFTSQASRYADENLFYTQKAGNNWGPTVYIDSVFNTPVNEGMATFTRDGRQLFFTACQRRDVGGTCDIRKAKLKDVEIIEIEALKGFVNSEKWESQACISCDGSALFFSSNRKEGYGKTDLYISLLQVDGTWGPAKNLGPTINTDKDEESPFITNDGKTLFFSSTGHLGMGEQDLFMSRLDDDGNWGIAVNLGPPINTAYRELGFFLSADGKRGFFSSNRPNGIGNMDIYEFNLSEELSSEPITLTEGFVKDSITLEPVQTIVYPKNHAPVQTDEEGRFFLCLKAEEDFNFKIEESPYLPYHRIIDIPVWDNKTLYPIEILLQTLPEPEEKVIKSDTLSQVVFFEFDQFSLGDSTQQQLQLFAQKLANQEVQALEIVGFCDYYGSNQYNLVLSRNRAQAVADFLTSLGITAKNSAELSIEIDGKGEVNDQAPRAKNRRVEIRLILK